MSKDDKHVVKRSEGWAVRGEGNIRDTSHHNTQQEAFESARENAMRKGGEVFIHGRDGKFRERNTYDKDPYPPKG